MDSVTRYLLLSILNVPLFIFIGRFFFHSKEDFWEAVKFSFMPNFISFFFGEYRRDVWTSFKLGVFIVVCGILVYGESNIIQYFSHA